jgi:hypothetical protein|uniref:CELR1 n=1 Tax=Humicola insolens TaxID=85995 RepID=A0A5B9CTW5_HUMIN|nr:CELR1 [Humicola insolens]
MTATNAPSPGQASTPAVYDPDEGFLRDSPPLQPLRPTLQPAQSPASSSSSSSSSSSQESDNKDSTRRRRMKPSQGDAVLIGYLDSHRRERSAYFGDFGADEPDDDVEDDPGMREDTETLDENWGSGDASTRQDSSAHSTGNSMAATRTDEGSDQASLLKSLAATALAATAERAPQTAQPDAGLTRPVADHDASIKPQPTRAMSISTMQPEPLVGGRNAPIPSPYSPRSVHSPRESGATPSSYRTDLKSPTTSIRSTTTHSEGLPPISPNRFESNGQSLPSIRQQLGGELPPLTPGPVVGSSMRGPHPGFPASPPPAMQQRLLPSLGSPPLPPSTDPYRDNPLSPGGHPLAPSVTSPGFYYQQNGQQRRPPEFGSTSSETSSARPSSASPPASAFDRMSIDGITVQPTTGNYVCKYPGCTMPPFQTQYLLNSHAKVHSSERPHYCPVPGCPRGEGGKGFKRKNEMIRHGLVHASPGYVCPFCPDRDHKYPRPDNLQRYGPPSSNAISERYVF